MSKYTTAVRYICETNTSIPIEGNGFDNVSEIINTSRANIFNFDYPLFDNSYKPVLEKKILMHYYTREISEETVGLWKLRLCDKLNLIMPYYNQLYESALIDFDPLIDVDYTRHKKLDKTGNNDITTHENRNKDYTDNTVKDYIDNTIDNKVKNTNENVSYTDYDNTDSNTIESGINNVSKNESGIEQNNSVETKHDTENYNKTGSKSGTDNTSTDGTKYQLYSDTPQGSLVGVENETYLTNVTKTIDSGSNTDITKSETISEQDVNNIDGVIDKNGNISKANDTNSVETKHNTVTDSEISNKTGNRTVENVDNSVDTGLKSGNSTNSNSGNVQNVNDSLKVYGYNTTDEYVDTITGKRGSYSFSKMLMDFRQTFINIDRMIIDELSDLFFGLWE